MLKHFELRLEERGKGWEERGNEYDPPCSRCREESSGQ